MGQTGQIFSQFRPSCLPPQPVRLSRLSVIAANPNRNLTLTLPQTEYLARLSRHGLGRLRRPLAVVMPHTNTNTNSIILANKFSLSLSNPNLNPNCAGTDEETGCCALFMQTQCHVKTIPLSRPS